MKNFAANKMKKHCSPARLAIIFIVFLSACSDYSGNTGSDQGDISAPIAIAQAITLGPPTDSYTNTYTTRANSEVVLTGKNSTSASAPVMIFNWKQIDNSGYQVELIERTTTTIAVNIPSVASPTTLEFQLEVQSANGITATDTIAIHVLPGDDENHFLMNPGIPRSTYELVAVLDGGQQVGTNSLPFEFEVTTIAHWKNFDGEDDQMPIKTETFSGTFPANFSPAPNYQGIEDPRNPVFSVGIENIDADDINHLFEDVEEHRRIEAYDLASAYIEHQINVTNTSGLSFQLVPIDKNGQQINLSNIGDLIRYQLGMPNAISANNYYNLIDPNGDSATFSGWKQQAGFTDQYGNDIAPDAANALYLNNYDLGFGRDMWMRWDNDGNVYAYVINYPSVENGIKNIAEFAVVAMEYSDNPDPAGVNPKIVKFYAFVYDKRNGDFLRSTSLNFDGRGEKYLPEACAGCHQGYPGSRPYIHPSEADIGATFIPWDIGSFLFSDAASERFIETTLNKKEFAKSTLQKYSRTSQEEAIRQFNIGTLKTMKDDPVRYAASIELIHGWYGDENQNLPIDELPQQTFNEDYVQSGWIGQEALYHEVYAPHCRVCHTQAKNDQINFDSYAEFMANTKLPSYIFERGLMPMARLTMDRFWTPNVHGNIPAELLRSHLASNGVNVVSSIPGAVIPNIAVTNQVLPTIDEIVTLDARESFFAEQYQWSLLSKPPGSTAALNHTDMAISSFTPDVPGGTYEVQLKVTGRHGDEQFKTVSITAGDRSPKAECLIADSSGLTDQGLLAGVPVLDNIPTSSSGDGGLGIVEPVNDGALGSVIVDNNTGTISYQLFNPFNRGVDDLEYSIVDFDGSLSTSPDTCHTTPQPGSGVITIDTTPAGTLVPTNVIAALDSINNSHGINISWEAPTGIVAESYKLFRNGLEVSPPGYSLTNFSESGLQENTQYNYTVRTVVNGFESNDSSQASVTTLSLLPLNPIATANSTTEAELNWNQPAANYSYYSIYRDGNAVTSSAAPRFTDSGLMPGETYSYQVSATDSSGQESALTNPAVITLPPVAPNGLQLSLDPVNDTSQVNLSWAASGIGLVDYYHVYRDGVLIATPPGTSFTNNSLSPYTDYSYKVSAVSNGAESTATLTEVIRTAAAGSTEPTNLLAGNNASNDASSIDLSWDGPSGYTADHYSVYRNGIEIASNILATTFTDTGLANGTSYSYTVTAFYNGEESSPSNQVVQATLSLQPLALAGSTISTNQVDLNWSAPAATVDNYTVFRNGSPIGTTASNGFSDNTALTGTQYSYTITATQGLETSSPSAPLLISSAPNPASTLLAAVDVVSNTSEVDLTWTAASGPVDSYSIYRDGVEVGSTASTSYSDTGLAAGTDYNYTVRAVVNGVESIDSNTANVNTYPLPPGSLGSNRNGGNPETAINLNWTAASGGVSSYAIYRNGANVGSTTLTSFNDSGLVPGTAYTYSVRSVSNGLESDDSNSSVRETLPAAPSNLAATVNAANNTSQVDLTWTAPAGIISNYTILQNGSPIATTASTSYNVTGLASDTNYSFTVRSNLSGNETLQSGDSNTDNARTYVSWTNDINNATVLECVTCHDVTYPTMSSHLQSARLPLCLSGNDPSGYCDILNAGPMPQYLSTDPEYQIIQRWINQGRREDN